MEDIKEKRKKELGENDYGSIVIKQGDGRNKKKRKNTEKKCMYIGRKGEKKIWAEDSSGVARKFSGEGGTFQGGARILKS